VYSATEDKVVGNSPLPAVFTSPIRSDIVQFVHTNMAKNSRQAYAVNRLAGHKHSAESWGTGRAVARVPRISGGGTNKSGSGAFANMCKSGRMFAPTKIYRRWHRKINLHQKRYAVCSALAASALPSLVMARGHKIDNIAEVPLVVDDSIQALTKTKDALAFLSTIRAFDDVARANASKELRAGQGKMRNRRYVARRGPMLVLPDNKGVQAFRNIFGLDIANVGSLNLLQLAPGGHLGRFIIWSKGAFSQLDNIFGTLTTESTVKKGFVLPPSILTNSDISRILKSEEVRRVLTPKKLPTRSATAGTIAPTNGIRNRRLRLRLNPFEKKRAINAGDLRNPARIAQRRKSKAARLTKARKGSKKMIANVTAKKASKAASAPKAAGKKAPAGKKA
jgi:large subunit ribosomal protein L4e